tara:strand:+ start:26 stop:430 length:405 start_codon:yes stop_codon:yes gene_type:complete
MKNHALKANMLVTLLAFSPAFVLAQNEEQMKRMMEQAQKAQTCMEQIDRSKLEALAGKAVLVEADIELLCDAGKRDEAQRQGMTFALKMSQSDVAKYMRKCSRIMAGAMGTSFMPGMSSPSLDGIADDHVCDSY